MPRHASAVPLEGHGQALKVPEQGTQRPEEVDAEDEVEAAEREADAGDGERLAADGDRDVMSDPLTRHALAVGDGDKKVGAPPAARAPGGA